MSSSQVRILTALGGRILRNRAHPACMIAVIRDSDSQRFFLPFSNVARSFSLRIRMERTLTTSSPPSLENRPWLYAVLCANNSFRRYPLPPRPSESNVAMSAKFRGWRFVLDDVCLKNRPPFPARSGEADVKTLSCQIYYQSL